jgi:sugar/nucleoside kinase (ribokinase family)
MSVSVRPALAIGEVLIDLIAADEATRLEDVTLFAARPGGAPANVAVAL